MKQQGYIGMYNGINVLQMQHYIKISCTLYITKICDKYITSWMQSFTSTEDQSTPLPADPTWMKKFNAATGDPDLKVQAKLAKTMGLSYRSSVGELIWAMTTFSQANACLHDHHFHGVKHFLKYLYSTHDNGIYFWHTAPCIEFKEGPIPHINSNKQDLLLDDCPEYGANVLHAYADLDWATCVKTH